MRPLEKNSLFPVSGRVEFSKTHPVGKNVFFFERRERIYFSNLRPSHALRNPITYLAVYGNCTRLRLSGRLGAMRASRDASSSACVFLKYVNPLYSKFLVSFLNKDSLIELVSAIWSGSFGVTPEVPDHRTKSSQPASIRYYCTVDSSRSVTRRVLAEVVNLIYHEVLPVVV